MSYPHIFMSIYLFYWVFISGQTFLPIGGQTLTLSSVSTIFEGLYALRGSQKDLPEFEECEALEELVRISLHEAQNASPDC